jgi:alanine racemase
LKCFKIGSVKIAEILENNGAQFFAVATLDEAIELRLHNINAKLLVLGAISPKDINKAIQYDITLTVPSQFWLERAIH